MWRKLRSLGWEMETERTERTRLQINNEMLLHPMLKSNYPGICGPSYTTLCLSDTHAYFPLHRFFPPVPCLNFYYYYSHICLLRHSKSGVSWRLSAARGILINSLCRTHNRDNVHLSTSNVLPFCTADYSPRLSLKEEMAEPIR